jgi:hypothetical protein
LYRSIHGFKKGYQPRTNTVKGEKGDLVTDSRSILARRLNHLSQLLNVHGVNDDRQTKIQTAQPLIPKANANEFEMANKRLKKNFHKPSDINQNQAELIEAGGRAIISEIHTLVNSIWNKEEMPEESKESITVSIYKGDKTYCSDFRGISLLSTTYKILSNM